MRVTITSKENTKQTIKIRNKPVPGSPSIAKNAQSRPARDRAGMRGGRCSGGPNPGFHDDEVSLYLKKSTCRYKICSKTPKVSPPRGAGYHKDWLQMPLLHMYSKSNDPSAFPPTSTPSASPNSLKITHTDTAAGVLYRGSWCSRQAFNDRPVDQRGN